MSSPLSGILGLSFESTFLFLVLRPCSVALSASLLLLLLFISCEILVCFTKYELCQGNVCVKCF